MAPKTIQGSEALAKQIRSRRNELGLTIEEAASRASVGTKTWSRYEAGESIRKDKWKGICKVLNWNTFPEQDREMEQGVFVQKYRGHEAWSKFLEENFGTRAAIAFSVGSDILLDHIEEDMSDLAPMPVGTHIGQLKVSHLYSELPQQFLMHYDYEFLYQLKCYLCMLRKRARRGNSMQAHSVMEELLIYLCNEEASVFMELYDANNVSVDDEYMSTDEWIFDLFSDMDIVSFLYSDLYLSPDHLYHFSHWNDQVFYKDHPLE